MARQLKGHERGDPNVTGQWPVPPSLGYGRVRTVETRLLSRNSVSPWFSGPRYAKAASFCADVRLAKKPVISRGFPLIGSSSRTQAEAPPLPNSRSVSFANFPMAKLASLNMVAAFADSVAQTRMCRYIGAPVTNLEGALLIRTYLCLEHNRLKLPV
jgi:hypothetical protein